MPSQRTDPVFEIPSPADVGISVENLSCRAENQIPNEESP